MKKIQYYIKNEFNGIASTFTPAEAVTFSKSTFPRVVRVPVDSGFRYFLRGIEIQREEIFLTGGEKPKARKKAKPIKINKRVFRWKNQVWMQSIAKARHTCHLTAAVIYPGTVMYRTDIQGKMISKARLSEIPFDAELI